MLTSVCLALLFVAELGCTQETRRPNLKTYPASLTVEENSDAVLDCRDEGPLRAQVQWLRNNRVQVSHRGRLIIRRVQVRHAGTYTCRALGLSRTPAGTDVDVRLQVQRRVVPRRRPRPPQRCTFLEAQCRNGECVPKEFVCDGEFDCTDGSDELHCKPGSLPPTPRRTPYDLQARPPSVVELRAPVACGKDEAPCRNGECISFKIFCDGEFDCTDGSDELHCNKTALSKSHQMTVDKLLRWVGGNTVNETNPLPRPQWGVWSHWGRCSELCEQERSRECRAAERTVCEGAPTERRKCPMKDCQVDGGWSAWTAWTSCSESCGRGTRRRYRKCDSPAPNYGGAYCHGSDGQQENCVQVPCATRGQWGPWGKWSACSRGKNETRVRRRECEVGGPDCRGVDVLEAPCNPCPRNLKIGMKPVRVTVSWGRLVNLTCHYRKRGNELLTLELDLVSTSHSNEVIKRGYKHVVIKDSLTATRCGARRRWTLLLGGEQSLVRCVVRDAEGRVLGKAESKILSEPSNSLLCHDKKSCQEVRVPKKSWKKTLSPPTRVTKEEVKKETPLKKPWLSGSPPRIVQVHPSFQVVHQGSSAHIMCLVSGDPPMDIQWRAEGRELSPRASTDGGLIQLNGILVSDAGQYICTVQNSAGVAHSSASVVVT